MKKNPQYNQQTAVQSSAKQCKAVQSSAKQCKSEVEEMYIPKLGYWLSQHLGISENEYWMQC